MNINAPNDRLIGSFGIVGGTIAAATGVALALKRVGGVAVCQFGDGAINQGYFYECLNFCAVLRLPVVFLCENNGYGEYTPFQEVTAGAIGARAEAMEVPAETVDGIHGEIEMLLQELERKGLEAPFPEPRTTREFSG